MDVRITGISVGFIESLLTRNVCNLRKYPHEITIENKKKIILFHVDKKEEFIQSLRRAVKAKEKELDVKAEEQVKYLLNRIDNS